MKILYVTPEYPGFSECLYNGTDYPHGLPSFNEVAMELIKQGNQVDFIIVSPKNPIPPLNIKVDWLKPAQIKEIVYAETKFPEKYLLYFKVMKLVDKYLKEGDYDFVYGHSTISFFAMPIAKKYKIPFGQRLYGTFMWDRIQKNGFIKAIKQNFFEYLSFKTKKEFLIVTNDGSNGNLVLNKVLGDRKPPFDFHFLINGVDHVESINEIERSQLLEHLKPGPFIFMCARFDSWKRQDRVLNVLTILRSRGYILNAYFAGPERVYNGTQYFDSIKEKVHELCLSNQVVFLGNIDRTTINQMNQLAIASLCIYDTCCMSNVFHESLAAGSIMIARKDGQVDSFINNGVNGFLVEFDDDTIADIIEYLINNPQEADRIREEAKKTSAENMMTWKQRVEVEIQIIKEHVGGL